MCRCVNGSKLQDDRGRNLEVVGRQKCRDWAADCEMTENDFFTYSSRRASHAERHFEHLITYDTIIWNHRNRITLSTRLNLTKFDSHRLRYDRFDPSYWNGLLAAQITKKHSHWFSDSSVKACGLRQTSFQQVTLDIWHLLFCSFVWRCEVSLHM